MVGLRQLPCLPTAVPAAPPMDGCGSSLRTCPVVRLCVFNCIYAVPGRSCPGWMAFTSYPTATDVHFGLPLTPDVRRYAHAQRLCFHDASPRIWNKPPLRLRGLENVLRHYWNRTCYCVAQWHNGSVAGLAINRSRVRLPAAALPSSNPGQVVHTCQAPLKLSPSGAIKITVILTRSRSFVTFLPARRSKRGICYVDVAGCSGWLSVCHSQYCV